MHSTYSFILEADRLDQKMRVSPVEVSKALKEGNAPKLIDVRTPNEWGMAHIEGSQLIDEELAQQIYKWPKDTAIVFLCHNGQRSMDAAAYFLATYLSGTQLPSSNPCLRKETSLEECVSSLDGMQPSALFEAARSDLLRWQEWLGVPMPGDPVQLSGR